MDFQQRKGPGMHRTERERGPDEEQPQAIADGGLEQLAHDVILRYLADGAFLSFPRQWASSEVPRARSCTSSLSCVRSQRACMTALAYVVGSSCAALRNCCTTRVRSAGPNVSHCCSAYSPAL